MTRVLVTGASGFVGTALVQALGRSAEVVALSTREGDIVDPATLARVRAVDHVFHLAGRTFVPASWKEPTDFVRTNVLGTANVIDFCARARASLTYVSAYIYGKPDRLPIPETTAPRPNNPYALSKHLAERLCEFAAKYQGVRVTVVRPFNIYGPGQPDHFLIPTIVRQVRAGGPVRLKDLKPKRDYIHLDDLVRLLVSTMQEGSAPYRVLNAGSGESYSVDEIVKLIQQAAGTAHAVLSDQAPRYEELDDVRADIRVARETLGWAPQVSLAAGIARLVGSSL